MQTPSIAEASKNDSMYPLTCPCDKVLNCKQNYARHKPKCPKLLFALLSEKLETSEQWAELKAFMEYHFGLRAELDALKEGMREMQLQLRALQPPKAAAPVPACSSGTAVQLESVYNVSMERHKDKFKQKCLTALDDGMVELIKASFFNPEYPNDQVFKINNKREYFNNLMEVSMEASEQTVEWIPMALEEGRALMWKLAGQVLMAAYNALEWEGGEAALKKAFGAHAGPVEEFAKKLEAHGEMPLSQIAVPTKAAKSLDALLMAKHRRDTAASKPSA